MPWSPNTWLGQKLNSSPSYKAQKWADISIKGKAPQKPLSGERQSSLSTRKTNPPTADAGPSQVEAKTTQAEAKPTQAKAKTTKDKTKVSTGEAFPQKPG
ncbi:hypothetical protein RB213_002369 [Colletotrichum asianum]